MILEEKKAEDVGADLHVTGSMWCRARGSEKSSFRSQGPIGAELDAAIDRSGLGGRQGGRHRMRSGNTLSSFVKKLRGELRTRRLLFPLCIALASLAGTSGECRKIDHYGMEAAAGSEPLWEHTRSFALPSSPSQQAGGTGVSGDAPRMRWLRIRRDRRRVDR